VFCCLATRNFPLISKNSRSEQRVSLTFLHFFLRKTPSLVFWISATLIHAVLPHIILLFSSAKLVITTTCWTQLNLKVTNTFSWHSSIATKLIMSLPTSTSNVKVSFLSRMSEKKLPSLWKRNSKRNENPKCNFLSAEKFKAPRRFAVIQRQKFSRNFSNHILSQSFCHIYSTTSRLSELFYMFLKIKKVTIKQRSTHVTHFNQMAG